RYVDRSTIVPIGQLESHLGRERTVAGSITHSRVEGGKRSRLRVVISDGSGSMEAVWFHGLAYMRNQVTAGTRVLLTGKASRYNGIQMVHPQVERLEEGRDGPELLYQPQYRITLAMKEAGIGQKTLRDAIAWLLANVKHYPATLPNTIEQSKGFAPLAECIARIHAPNDLATLGPYHRRIRYERLYTIALSLRWSRRGFSLPGRPLPSGVLPSRLERQLPFELTTDQRRAIAQLHADAADSRRMHRLLQGDVGSGKTVVAVFACLPALENGYQVAWMTPTEVLARQTFTVLRRMLQPLGIEPALLTGSVSDKSKTVAGLRSGSVQLVVGTHALLQPSVAFAKLGMIVIDEQHRFGIEQRTQLQQKGAGADFLLMSATPIPQTLAQTIYGDLDVVSIRSLPAGRLPVQTHLVPAAKRGAMEGFIREQIEHQGAQAYYVVPRIEANDEEESELKDLVSTYDALAHGPFSGVPSALVHGRLAAEEKERVVADFTAGRVKLLAATTVVEVGIDAPGATVMVIEDADRFGLSALHQLRGRVGRSTAQAYCFLLCSSPARDGAAGERLQEFCRNHDGFALAELDLKLRGPGHLTGMRQSGWDDRDMELVLDEFDLFREVQGEVEALFDARPPAAGSFFLTPGSQ
ncbi:MAG: DEAD/DEAH box helicase, partial [Chitinivibrionales bacterium]|nr:DEAD/DEAH box helicase [Chitinivibrionales bacterium]